jgi:5-methylcytosine-specific restriction endonuclease McrA
MDACVIYSAPLSGKQKKFCGRRCKNQDTNYHHQSYQAQQLRGRERKLKLISIAGGCCSSCGYSRNYSALEFHHLVPSEKSFQLDMRSLANLQWELIELEVLKCRLLCANCHAEHHNPDSILNATARPTQATPDNPPKTAGNC